MSLQHALIDILADGQFHSGNELGEKLNVSRSAVWKALQQLRKFDVDIHAVHGRGYRLAEPLELLDSHRIQPALNSQTQKHLQSLDILFDVDSTNAWLLKAQHKHAVVCLAERQHAGRGRRGREWISPFAANLTMSLGWRFELDITAMSSFSLICGVAVVRALQKFGVSELGLKWPNDIIYQGKKLGGILIEMRGESGGPCDLVVGVGLNVSMPASMADIDQPWIDLRHSDVAESISRNLLAAAMIDELIHACIACSNGQSDDYLKEWRELNIYSNKPVSIHMMNGSIVSGNFLDIDESGALLLESAGERQRFTCGEVSLRSG
ncbi:MAG: bifunctional biotin--[acetyl-CoA-carboxylase] ligase/biotin operon repressor BirA [Sulfuriflexus sp.]|nr:bifunctional biotin--[acetyl-CoA-carboxylase] ligase/biotin operon repressor BirA [Sulfuriflexus sp.]